jgi:cytochrome b561
VEREENINLTDFDLIKSNKVLKSSPVKNRFVPGKAYINFWIDFIAFLSFIICTVSGAALMRMQHGAFHSSGYTRAGLLNDELFWGLPGYEWAHLHNLTGWILVALIILHIAMHWQRTFRAGYAVFFLNFLICTVSGAALMLLSQNNYGTGTGSLNGELFWDLPGNEWAHLHNFIGWIFVVFAIIHIVRYHRWITRMGIRALHLGNASGKNKS